MILLLLLLLAAAAHSPIPPLPLSVMKSACMHAQEDAGKKRDDEQRSRAAGHVQGCRQAAGCRQSIGWAVCTQLLSSGNNMGHVTIGLCTVHQACVCACARACYEICINIYIKYLFSKFIHITRNRIHLPSSISTYLIIVFACMCSCAHVRACMCCCSCCVKSNSESPSKSQKQKTHYSLYFI